MAHGREEVNGTVRHYVGAFENYDWKVKRLTDLGLHAVLAVVTEEGRGRGSGAPVRQSFAVLYIVIDGKISRVTFFSHEDQALEAAGQRE